jgi:hypothetical protein
MEWSKCIKIVGACSLLAEVSVCGDVLIIVGSSWGPM